MTTLVQRTLTEVTGEGIDQLPKLPMVLPVQGFARRWAAEHFYQFTDGTPVTSWRDLTSGSNALLTPSDSQIAGATAPRLSTRDGNRVVSFNGTTDAIGGPFTVAEPTTFTAVIYLPEKLANKFLITTINSLSTFAGLGIEASSLIKYWGNGYQATGPTINAGWHIITVIADGVNTSVRLDQTTSAPATVQTGTNSQTMINFGGSVHSASRARMELADFFLYRRKLSAQEIELIHVTCKQHYEI